MSFLTCQASSLLSFIQLQGLQNYSFFYVFDLPVSGTPKCFFLLINGAANIQQGTLLFWGKLMYLVCQRCGLGITPLRLSEPMKIKNKNSKTNKPKNHVIKQTNQHTPIFFYPTPNIWTNFDFPKSFPIYCAVLPDQLMSCTSHFKNRIHKDSVLLTSDQKSSITTLKYPVKIAIHFKEYFAFSFTEFPMPPHFFLLCLLYTGNMLLSHGTVTYIIRIPHLLLYISNLNCFWINTGKRVK